MCNCKSYNKPEWGGDRPEVMVPKPDWSERTSDTIGLDACIADDILKLWANGIRTLSSCCGHMKAPPSIVVESKTHPKEMADAYIAKIKKLVPGWEVYQWELTQK